MAGKENLILTASPTDARTAARRAVQTAMFILSRSRKNEPRKRTKGPNTPWHPAKPVAFCACRSWWLYGERCRKTKFSTSSPTASPCAASRARSVKVLLPILCLAAKNRRRKGTKRPNALWIPAVRLCGRASAQHDAKVSIFSFCERDLNKVALTGVARTPL